MQNFKLAIASFLILLVTSEVSAQKVSKHFANINGNSFKIVGDISKLKKEATDLLSKDSLKLNFDKIDVQMQKSIGEVIEDFYFVKLTDTNNGAVAAKLLTRKGNKLYFSDVKDVDQFYAMCRGTERCEPNLYIEKSDKMWMCGDKLECLKPTEKSFCTKTIGVVTY